MQSLIPYIFMISILWGWQSAFSKEVDPLRKMLSEERPNALKVIEELGKTPPEQRNTRLLKIIDINQASRILISNVSEIFAIRNSKDWLEGLRNSSLSPHDRLRAYLVSIELGQVSEAETLKWLKSPQPSFAGHVRGAMLRNLACQKTKTKEAVIYLLKDGNYGLKRIWDDNALQPEELRAKNDKIITEAIKELDNTLDPDDPILIKIERDIKRINDEAAGVRIQRPEISELPGAPKNETFEQRCQRLFRGTSVEHLVLPLRNTITR